MENFKNSRLEQFLDAVVRNRRFHIAARIKVNEYGVIRIDRMPGSPWSFVDLAGFHYENDFAQRVNVLGRVPFNGDGVGQLVAHEYGWQLTSEMEKAIETAIFGQKASPLRLV